MIMLIRLHLQMKQILERNSCLETTAANIMGGA